MGEIVTHASRELMILKNSVFSCRLILGDSIICWVGQKLLSCLQSEIKSQSAVRFKQIANLINLPFPCQSYKSDNPVNQHYHIKLIRKPVCGQTGWLLANIFCKSCTPSFMLLFLFFFKSFISQFLWGKKWYGTLIIIEYLLSNLFNSLKLLGDLSS